jgi:hypothetical protein
MEVTKRVRTPATPIIGSRCETGNISGFIPCGWARLDWSDITPATHHPFLATVVTVVVSCRALNTEYQNSIMWRVAGAGILDLCCLLRRAASPAVCRAR